MKNKLVKLTMIVLSIILILFQAPAVIIYSSIFNYRCTSETQLMPNIADFEMLERTRYEFDTRKNKKLVGYLYSYKDIDKKGLVVFAHGLGGGGQIGYLEIYNYLSSNGYYVFAYDATGNDESEGKAIGGLPQGIIDLDYAINFTETLNEVKELPLMLMGFSWGAFSVSNVLNYHNNVKAVVSISGWNKSLDLIEYYGANVVGPFSKILLPFVSLYEQIKYGKYAFSNAMNAFKNTESKIMIVHSEDDETVPIKYGYDRYYEKYCNDKRFIFKHYNERGHENVFYSETGTKYYADFLKDLESYKKQNTNITQEMIYEYINKNIDRKKMANRLDYALFSEIVEFYNSCL